MAIWPVEEEKEEQDEIEAEVNFTIQIIEEALDFIDTLKDMITLFYSSCIEKTDMEILDEDLYKLVVGSVIKG